MNGIPVPRNFWNIADIAALKEKWADGWSATQIANLVGRSRNAVISKVHSQNLPEPEKKNSRLARKRSPKDTSVKPTEAHPFLTTPVPRLRNGHAPALRRNPSHNIEASIEAAQHSPGLAAKYMSEEPDGTGVKFVNLEAGQCKWPKGDPLEADFEFCGAKALPDLPYCAHHMRKASRNRLERALAGV